MNPYIWANILWLPLIYIVANWFLSFQSNGAKDRDITSYIDNSIVDTIVIPKDMVKTRQQYDAWFSRGGGGIKDMVKYAFYSPKYKKYLQLITFHHFDTNYVVRNMIIDPVLYGIDSIGIMLLARINLQQMDDTAYGTKKNPVPVFGMDWISRNAAGYYDTNGRYNTIFHISDRLNRIFVGQYLNRFMPKAEFKKMFRQ